MAKSKLKRASLWSGAAVLAFFLWAGGEYTVWAKMQHRITTIAEGRVYHSAAIPPDEIVGMLEDAGIDTVIDLRDNEPEAIEAERAALAGSSIRYIHHPSVQLPPRETIDGFIETLRGELDQDRTVLLHCHHGEGRAPLYAAIYRIEFEDWDPKDALDAIIRLPPRLLFLQRVIPGLGRLSANNPKRGLLLDYTPQGT